MPQLTLGRYLPRILETCRITLQRQRESDSQALGKRATCADPHGHDAIGYGLLIDISAEPDVRQAENARPVCGTVAGRNQPMPHPWHDNGQVNC
jgi:hypothetical protein